MDFKVVGNQFLRDGKPVKLISGAVHYFRNLPDSWDDIFAKMRALGLNTVETYTAWNMHEPKPCEFNFEGRPDITSSLKRQASTVLWLLCVPPLTYVPNGNSADFPGGSALMKMLKFVV